MNEQIDWKEKTTSFTGRNGTFKCTGIDLVEFDDNKKLIIHPITSKNAIGNCNIIIPTEKIPELIEKLKTLLKN